jgi:hypothetical protein
MTISEIRQANAAAGFRFFSTGAMKFFRSRVDRHVYEGPGGVFFVTSEQLEFHESQGPRKWTVHQFRRDGSIDRASEFQQYESLQQARAAASAFAKPAAPGGPRERMGVIGPPVARARHPSVAPDQALFTLRLLRGTRGPDRTKLDVAE